jgi:hypothetical protein
MFMVDYGARRKKPRRRYWWGAMGFVAGMWLGVMAGQRLESARAQTAAASLLAAPGAAGPLRAE